MYAGNAMARHLRVYRIGRKAACHRLSRGRPLHACEATAQEHDVTKQKTLCDVVARRDSYRPKATVFNLSRIWLHITWHCLLGSFYNGVTGPIGVKVVTKVSINKIVMRICTARARGRRFNASCGSESKWPPWDRCCDWHAR